MIALLSATAIACATTGERRPEPELPDAPPEEQEAPVEQPPDAQELFRRARFAELSRRGPDALAETAGEIVGEGVRAIERKAWAAYRRGELDEARKHVAKLRRDSNLKKIIDAMVNHADRHAPIRESNPPKHLLELPLVEAALDKGYPVIDAEIHGKRFHLLWDTGTTENILGTNAFDALELGSTNVMFTVKRDDDGIVLRFTATATRDLALATWQILNVPWLVTDLSRIEPTKREVSGIDGFLSPQLLIPNGCFAIDRLAAVLRIGFGLEACDKLMATTKVRSALYSWNGHIYANVQVDKSPLLAVQMETGSPVTFLRTHATRWLPRGMLYDAPEETEEELATELGRTVRVQLADRAKSVSAIDLLTTRTAGEYDDIATLGNDLLLDGSGIVVNFSSMVLGTLDR